MWKAIFAAAIAVGLAYYFYGVSQPVPTYQGAPAFEDPFPPIGPANTDRTVPTSPYDHPSMTLQEMETATRNSSASQEVNRNLNTEFANYSEPVAAVAWLTALAATLLLVVKSMWYGIPLVSSIAAVLGRGFFRWPRSPLEWVNKLAIYIGLAQSLWVFF